jgi:hypothetical protein
MQLLPVMILLQHLLVKILQLDNGVFFLKRAIAKVTTTTTTMKKLKTLLKEMAHGSSAEFKISPWT